MSHAGILAIGQMPGPFKDLMGRLPVGSGIVRSCAPYARKNRVGESSAACSSPMNEGPEQDRGIEQRRMRLDQMIRQITALGETDQYLPAMGECRGIQQ